MKKVLLVCCLALSGTMMMPPVSVADVYVSASEVVNANPFVIEDGILTECTDKNVEVVALDDSVKVIDRNAFEGCLNLKEVTMTNSVQFIGENAFDGCPKLEKVVLSGRVAHENCENIFGTIHDGLEYTGINLSFATDGLSKDITENILTFDAKHSEQIKTVDIPNGYYALETDFSGCLNLETVTMSNSVHYILDNAFNACPKLEKVTLSGNIMNCEHIFGVTHEEFEYTGINLSFATDGLSKDIIENILRFDADHSEQIKTVDIPNGYYALETDFSGCLNLETVTMSNSVHHILDNAFNACPKLKKVKISSELVDSINELFAKSENFVSITYDGMVSGDVNNDGSITIADVVSLMNYLTTQNTKNPTMTADVNEDGKINIIDLIHLKKSFLS